MFLIRVRSESKMNSELESEFKMVKNRIENIFNTKVIVEHTTKVCRDINRNGFADEPSSLKDRLIYGKAKSIIGNSQTETRNSLNHILREGISEIDYFFLIKQNID
jgi:hypothetical protein